MSARGKARNLVLHQRGAEGAARTAGSFETDMGNYRRKVFYVSPEEAAEETSPASRPGWYVNTVDPPATWMNNDPLGPYPTLEKLLADAGKAYREEAWEEHRESDAEEEGLEDEEVDE